MKRVYERPMMFAQEFTANEYIAACGDSGTSYKFVCDAGNGWMGNVYIESNGEDGLQTGSNGDSYLSGYSACGTSHIADSSDDFLNGYFVPALSSTPVKVIIWRGPNNDNTHCTTNLDKSSWETAKS